MPRRRRNKKWISVVILLVLLIVAGVIVWLVWENYFKESPKGEPTREEQKSQTVTPTEPEKKEEPKAPEEKEEEKSKVPQYDGDDPNKADGITGAITYASKTGDNLVIRVNIDQYLSGGTCSLALRQGGGNAYSTTANVIDSAATSTCEGFNVPVAGFPAGKYNIIIYINSGDKTGEITGEVEL